MFQSNRTIRLFALLIFASLTSTTSITAQTGPKPTVSIESPNPAITYDTSDEIIATINATDADGEIARVNVRVAISGGEVLTTRPAVHQGGSAYAMAFADHGALSGLPDATYDIIAYAVDNSGQISKAESQFVIGSSGENLPPTVRFLSPTVEDDLRTGEDISIIVEALDDGLVEVVNIRIVFPDGSRKMFNTQLAADGNHELLLVAVEPGSYTFIAYAKDNEGLVSNTIHTTNISTSTTPTKPIVTIDAPVATGGEIAQYTNSSEVEVEVYADDLDGEIAFVNVRIEPSDSASTTKRAEFLGGNRHRLRLSDHDEFTNLSEGLYGVSAYAIDNEGNRSRAVSEFEIRNDSPGPSDLITSPVNNENFTNGTGFRSVTVEVDAPASADSIQFYINDYKVTRNSNADESFTFRYLQGGTYFVRVDALDNGNVIETDTVMFTVDDRIAPGQFNFRRLNGGKPIIDKKLFIAAGATRDDENENDGGCNPDPDAENNGTRECANEYDNMNGPTVIRVPDWIPSSRRAHPEAVYYCYFSHHQGQAIYMAWATDIEGPWTLYNVGPEVPNNEKGVLAFDNGDRYNRDYQQLDVGNGLTAEGHMASPDILIDDEKQQITMYWHSPHLYNDRDGDEQVTFAATSKWGLDFSADGDGVLGGVKQSESYLSTFRYDGKLYGINSSGHAWRHPDPENNLLEPSGTFDYRDDFYWEKRGGDRVFQWLLGAEGMMRGTYIRHIKTLVLGDTLYAAFSQTGGNPERLFYFYADISGDWETWVQYPSRTRATPIFLAQAEAGWEGGHFPIVQSMPSALDEGVNQLRDPQFFQDKDGEIYVFYSGQGEDAIGIAKLEWID